MKNHSKHQWSKYNDRRYNETIFNSFIVLNPKEHKCIYGERDLTIVEYLIYNMCLRPKIFIESRKMWLQRK